MADTRLVDQQVFDLEKVIKNDAATPDFKVQYINTIKSGIKQHNVPETCIPHLFEGLRGASSSPHAIIAAAGFTALNHLFTRMSRQDPKVLAKEAPRTLALVIEKLGDQRDKLRTLAHQSLTTMHGVAPVDVERFLRNQAMIGKNSRTKEAAMHWILQTHIEQGMPFRAYVQGLMELLEDADGVVRDTAKSTVIELFKTAPNGAKSDLKRQLKNFKVRPAIEQAIVKALVPSIRPETPSEPMGPPPPMTTRPALMHVSTAPVSSTTHDRPSTPAETPVESVQPMYINTNRELDETMKEMVPYFDGKESEHNWLKREQSIITLRRLLVGNAPADYQDTFITGLRALLDGITKAINSLRTSLSKEGCSLVQEVATTFGPAMDPLVELLMQTLVKLSAGTKKISSSMANTTIEIILGKVTYTPRLMQHLWGVFQDKNVQPRLYSCGWLRTVLKKEAHHKHHVEHTGGVDLMEKCIKKGLTDANPGVREKMRPTFWVFWSVWPQRAEAMMADLDATAQKLLNKDPSNPNSTGKAIEPAARAATGLSKATTRPSIREQVLAQKRAAGLAHKNLPPRPGSAMANLSPVRPTGPREAAAAPSRHAGTRQRPESTILGNAGGMSGAPMRPARKRTEVPRPATAGPYSIRDHPSTEGLSPDSLRQKSGAQSKPAPAPQSSKPQLQQTTPVKSLPRPRTIHVSRTSDFGPTSPPMPSPGMSITSPRISPLKYAKSCIPVSSPSRPSSSRYEELSLVVPPIPRSEVSSPQSVAAPELHLSRQASPVPPHRAVTQPDLSRKTRAEMPSSQTVQVYEDPFVEEHQVPQHSDLHAAPVLEEKPINEGAANPQRPANGQAPQSDELASPEKIGQNSRLLDSGITKIKAKSLEIHGFRKMQSLVRDSRTVFTDQRFETLLLGLFSYLEDPLRDLPAEKAHDVKAQILTTLKVLLKKERDSFQPHVSRGLEALLQARGGYDARAHVVSGLELLADELVALGSAPETLVVLTRRLQLCTDTTTEGCRTLSMGLHILKVVLDKHPGFVPSPAELAQLGDLASRCLDSTDSGVRMDAVQFCVAFHARVGDHLFWDVMKNIKENPKSLITYYIVKAQREFEA
ncbi:Protein STU1 [Escovopsis weberi]|uniref:Protein STU1 n=1 Tax=Escovopsis weberi TaxID=150374 RepID=A0A0M9VSW8_ESCWE|nr:Protein STU1 [Escovopsis weberi]